METDRQLSESETNKWKKSAADADPLPSNALGTTSELVLLLQEVDGTRMKPLKKSLNRELEEGAAQIRQKHKDDLIKELNLDQYSIKGTDDEWKTALGNRGKALISIKR